MRQTGLLQPLFLSPSPGSRALGTGTFANMGIPWSDHSYGTRSVGCRSHVSRAKPPLVARGLRRLCVHRKISISRGGAGDTEGSRRRPPHRRFPPFQCSTIPGAGVRADHKP